MVWIYLPFGAVVLFMVVYSVLMSRKECPSCGAKLELYQSPFKRTKRQWIEGGLVCRNCGCELDWRGRKIETGRPIRMAILKLILVALLVEIAIAVLLLCNVGAPEKMPPPEDLPDAIIDPPLVDVEPAHEGRANPPL
jgi:hypothetical protein